MNTLSFVITLSNNSVSSSSVYLFLFSWSAPRVPLGPIKCYPMIAMRSLTDLFWCFFVCLNLIVVLFGIPLVVLKEKNSLSFGSGASIFVIFGYYAFIKFGQSLGFNGIVEPLLSAWLGNILFLCGGIMLMWRAKT